MLSAALKGYLRSSDVGVPR